MDMFWTDASPEKPMTDTITISLHNQAFGKIYSKNVAKISSHTLTQKYECG